MNTMLRICRRRGVSWDRKAEILNMAFNWRRQQEGRVGRSRPPQTPRRNVGERMSGPLGTRKSFLVLFFKKEHSSLP